MKCKKILAIVIILIVILGALYFVWDQTQQSKNACHLQGDADCFDLTSDVIREYVIHHVSYDHGYNLHSNAKDHKIDGVVHISSGTCEYTNKFLTKTHLEYKAWIASPHEIDPVILKITLGDRTIFYNSDAWNEYIGS